MNGLLQVVGSVPAAVVLVHGVWWTGLSLVALPRPKSTLLPATGHRLLVVVPAHDEEANIGACVASLLAAPFDPTPEVLVVADNCFDGTAERAREAGAVVIERRSDSERGKSYALEYAIAKLAARPCPPEAVLFVDADTRVSSSFFQAIAASLDEGAEAVQVHYAAEESEGTLPGLRRLALLLLHWSRPLGAERLGLGTGLKGNGMALRWDVLSEGRWATGITEDAAMTLSLAERGVAVRFTPHATVWGQMASSYEDAATQDRRWEGGRLALAPRAVAVALRAAVRGRFAAAAGAAEVATLPLSLLGGLAIASVVLAVASVTSLPVALMANASLVTYVVVGLAAARPRPADLLALRGAPRFFAYKLGVLAGLLRRRQVTWDRTSRG